ncbi:hypothetical protein HMPREF9565_01090 [Cutibacterium acnes HL053PA2]|nr:hypothetical protein HMPREF9595_01220 [Cutibacterium acnes HL005PA2]EFT50465.1 hypothetical protein HMPREF9565_01090 [Cutibacterium acnes HL053PA2]
MTRDILGPTTLMMRNGHPAPNANTSRPNWLPTRPTNPSSMATVGT